MKKLIFTIIFLSVFLYSCNGYENKHYIAQSVGNDNWEVNKIELTIDDREQEFEYSEIKYVGKENLVVDEIYFEFYLIGLGENDILEDKETLFMVSEGSDKSFEVNRNYSRDSGGIKGELINRNNDFDYEQIYLKVAYKIDGIIFEEVIQIKISLD